MDKKHDVFISYSRHDTQVVNEFVDRLERESFSVWIDCDGIESGDAFKKRILQAIKSSAVVLFFSSQHSNQSDWTAKEIGVAVKYKKSVIPILLDDSNFNEEVEFDLINLDYIDYQDASVRGIMMDRLVKSLKAKIPTPMGQKKAEEARLKAEAAERERLERERQEAERKAKEEAKKRAKQEAERKAKEEAEKRAKQEAERKAKEEAEKRAKEEAARKAKEAEESERKERERQAEEERKKVCRAVSDGLVFNVNGVEFKMIKVEGGTFWMGADNGKRTRTVKGFLGINKTEEYVDKNVRNYDADALDMESPVHSVTLSSYYIGEHQVTVEEFHNFVDATGYKTDAEKEGWAWRLMVVNGEWMAKKVNGLNWKYGTNGELRKWSEYRHPVIYVSWNDAVAYCKWLSQKTDTKFGLPTEAQWEFAARGGNLSKGYRFAGSNRIEEVGWYGNRGSGNAEGSTHIVGQKKPNELGIYDMSGNVWEWCNDWYDDYGSGSQTNPQGPSSDSNRVVRGGGWFNYAGYCRVSYRANGDPGRRHDSKGFRLCLPQ